MDLSKIEASILDSTYKGYPYTLPPLPISAIASQHWNALQDLPLPIAVLKQSALMHNLRWMRELTLAYGVEICPHGKTTMAPQLFNLQLEAGSWGITVANMHQAQIAIDAGVSRVVLANELVGEMDIKLAVKLMTDHPNTQLYSLVDSHEQLQQLDVYADSCQRPLQVFVEIGVVGGRTGLRSTSDAIALAQAIHKSQHVRLAGIECYEGLKIVGDHLQDVASVSALINQVLDVAVLCDQQKFFDANARSIIISAGGSAVIDLVAKSLTQPSTKLSSSSQIVASPLTSHGSHNFSLPIIPLLRSGCYVTHDAGTYKHHHELTRQRVGDEPWFQQVGIMRAALEVWCQVLSLPEEGLAILGIGRRDAGFDKDLPKPLVYIRRSTQQPSQQTLDDQTIIIKLMDQHAYMRYDPTNLSLKIGDLIGCGISHPCTTFDKWKWIPMVDDQYTVIDAIKTFF